MGSLQLCTPVGSIIMHKFLIASCLAVATLASPEADPSLIHGNALVGSGGISPAWPTTLGYGVQSTCYGCRGHYIGKRSAEADPYYGNGYAAPIYGYGHGIAHHGGHATSFVARSPQGLHGVYGHYIGKRSAEADPSYGYGYVAPIYGYGHGISQLHPGVASSFQAIHRLHKREAEAEPEADAYYGYGYGLGYGHRLGYGHHLGYHGLGYTHAGYYGHGYGHGYGYGYYG